MWRLGKAAQFGVHAAFTAIFGIGIMAVDPVQAQPVGERYEIPGIVAWTTAKTYGFNFNPEANSGESVSRPLDGMNTRLTRVDRSLLVARTITIAQVVGGQPSVNPNERNTTFTFFGGRTLQPGWLVYSVDVGGNFTYVQQPRSGTTDLSFRVRLAPGGSATVRQVVLLGPKGQDWKKAFSAPTRRDYVLNGVQAWNAAKKYGFTFQPLIEGLSPAKDNPRVLNPKDGVLTVLTARVGMIQICSPQYDGECVIGQVVGGNMSVPPPTGGATSQTVRFRMFGDKKLSTGWKVKSVTMSGGTWVSQPEAGGDNLSMVIKVTSLRGQSGSSSIINSITLEGWSSAASFEDAFKNPGN